MQIRRWPPLFIFIISSALFAETPFYYTVDDIDDFISGSLHEVKKILEMPDDPCSEVIPNSFMSRSFFSYRMCSFEKLCRPYVNNIDKEFLYISPDGSRVGNIRLHTYERMVNDCKALLTEKSFKTELTGAAKRDFESALEERKRLASLEKKGNVKKDSSKRLIAEYLKLIEKKKLLSGNENKFKTVSDADIQDVFTMFSLVNNFDPSPEYGRQFIATLKAEIKFLQNLDDSDYISLRKPKKLREDVFADPERLVFPNRFNISPEEESANKARFERGYQRIDALQEEVKKRMSLILDAKKNGTNDPIIEKLKAKVLSVKLRRFELTDDLLEVCPTPNAFYNAINHTFNICPQLFEYPETSLMATIGHELAHSIDPCRSGLHLQVFQGPFTGDVNYVSSAPEFNDDETLNTDKMTYGIKFKDYPFQSVVSCLQTSDSVSAKSPMKYDAYLYAKKMAEYLSRPPFETRPGEEPLFTRKKIPEERIEEMGDQFWACGTGLGVMQVNEAFCDWMGTKVLSSAINDMKNPDEKRKAALEGNSLFLGIACTEDLSGEINQKMVKLLKSHGCYENYLEVKQEQEERHKHDVHSQPKVRVERLMLASPEIEEALGCKAKGLECK